jgi:hypothetical protein
MNLVAINTQIKTNNYLRETVEQLEKYFLMCGINFDIARPESDYKGLFTSAYNLVNTLNQKTPKRLINLLYKIDLPEEKVRDEMQKTELSFTEMLSELIVKQEIYKVILRKRFSHS